MSNASHRALLSRRELARRTFAGTASLLLMNTSPLHAAPATTASVSEGDALTNAVPRNVGYALSPAQAAEVAAALKDYPAGFAKARAFALANDIAPAFAPSAPPAPARKGRAR